MPNGAGANGIFEIGNEERAAQGHLRIRKITNSRGRGLSNLYLNHPLSNCHIHALFAAAGDVKRHQRDGYPGVEPGRMTCSDRTADDTLAR